MEINPIPYVFYLIFMTLISKSRSTNLSLFADFPFSSANNTFTPVTNIIIRINQYEKEKRRIATNNVINNINLLTI